MIPINKCIRCGSEVMTKTVEKLLCGGNNTAIISVQAEVCLHCGERLYSQDTVMRFQQIREKLKRQETDDFEPVGQAFKVA